MAARPVTVAYEIRVTPDRRHVRSAALSVLLVTFTLFGVLYFLGLANGSWPVAVGGELVSLALTAIAYGFFRATYVGVTATTIEERGFLGRKTSFPRSWIDDVVLARTYRSSSSDTAPQLVIRDRDGLRLLRMRGSFWSEGTMTGVAAALTAEPTVPHEPMTTEAFFAEYPGTAYWFENRPVIAVVAVTLLFVLCVGIVLGLMTLLGLPVDPA